MRESGTDGLRPIADAPTIRSLIGQLEAATEGSRQLDADIWLMINPREAAVAIQQGQALAQKGSSEERLNAAGRRALERVAPHYTTSIDAAATLVMRSYQWNLADYSGFARASVGGTKKFGIADAPTAPLALCIAALKARAAVQVAEGRPEGPSVHKD